MIARHLRGTKVAGISDRELKAWGGAVHSLAQIEGAVRSLDGVIVLLEFAGYEVESVAFAISRNNATHTNANAVVLDLPWLSLIRGVKHAWPEQPPGAPRGRVGLWVRPRRARLPDDLWLDGCSVELRQELSLFADLGIGLDFSPTTDGWLTLPVELEGWAADLTRACELACSKLSDILGERLYVLAAGESLTKPGCGLLALLDPEGWQLGDPMLQGHVFALPRGSGARTLADAVFAQFAADPARFLLQDTAVAPLTVLERLGLDDEMDDPPALWAEMIDDLGGIDGSPGALGELRPEYGDLLSWTHMILWLHEIGVLDGLSAIAAAQPVLLGPAVAYGGYVLRRNDNDAAFRWGGRVAGVEDPRPAAGEYGYVRQLQLDLHAVGILLHTSTNGNFDVLTEMALREFEIAARFTQVARPLAGAAADAVLPQDTLEAVPLPASSRLTGPILGALEPAVRAALRQWLAAGWRHPVVLYAVRRGQAPLVNLWRWDAVKAMGAQVWAWDRSGQYDQSDVGVSRQPPYFVGRYSNRYHGGPASILHDVPKLWGEVALTPERLVGPKIEQTPEAERGTDPTWSTYRVVAAVGHVEMIEQFDALNAYDAGVISLGLYHWILAGGDAGGELGALFALLRERDPEAFEAVMGRFGVRPAKMWAEDGMYDEAAHTYGSELTMRRADGLWDPVRTTSGTDDEKQWFRGWCWFYRLQMACRTSEPLRRIMWDMGRLRVRDLLATPWPKTELSLGEIFTSERLVAMLLRWHVNLPGKLVGKDGVRGRLLARGLPPGEPTTWGTAEEEILAANILASVTFDPNLTTTVTEVFHNSTLSHGHKSFYPDWSGL